MMKRVSVLGLFISLILSLSLLGFGCKKAEQAKEEAKPAAKVEAPAKGITVVEFNFEDGVQKWGTHKNLKIAQNKTKKHSGQGSLQIIAKNTAKLWNVASSPKFDLVPEKHYKLSSWILVDLIASENPRTKLMLKVGVYKNDKWFKNFEAPSYDFTRKGEWQSQTVEFTAPPDSDLKFTITVEKRPMEKNVEATIYVDDLVLEKMN